MDQILIGKGEQPVSLLAKYGNEAATGLRTFVEPRVDRHRLVHPARVLDAQRIEPGHTGPGRLGKDAAKPRGERRPLDGRFLDATFTSGNTCHAKREYRIE